MESNNQNGSDISMSRWMLKKIETEKLKNAIIATFDEKGFLFLDMH
jgi:hypothetical protein